MIDVHTHVQFAAFSEDADVVIERALQAGVWMVNVGTQKDTSKKAIEIAEQYHEGVYATVGLHPIHTEKSYHDPQELGTFSHSQEYENVVGGLAPLEARAKGAADANVLPLTGFTSRGEEFDYAYYKKLAVHPKVVAIGECGLDYYRLDAGTKEKQGRVFVEHIRLAHEAEKPLMIHCRKAFADLIRILEHRKSDLPDPRGIVHFFSGSRDDARKLLDLGFSFSFGGVITFVRDYDDVVKYIPPERTLLETDAPYVAPVPYRGKRNEPTYVTEVAKKLAELKGLPFEEICDKTTVNAKLVFRL